VVTRRGVVQRRDLHVRATEAEPATAEAASASEATDSAPVAEALLSPMQRARQALETDGTDQASLETALADLDAQLEGLGAAVEAAEAKAALLESSASTAKDQLLRLNADFDNFRRRSREEKDALANSVRGDVVLQLLPLIDNFELARTQVKVETDAEHKINNSYQSLYKQMVDIMKGLGIEAVPTVGALFDPALHEAILSEPNNEVPDNTVLVEFRKGFTLGDRLLRPAVVKVASNDGTAAPEQPVTSQE